MHAEMYRFCEDSIYPCSGLSQNQKAMIPHALFHRDESVKSPNAYKSGQENPSQGCPTIQGGGSSCWTDVQLSCDTGLYY